nr:RNA-directed DNA polymerase, eukaryota, reverse transcriptase zinc-binding domain protein [Tanacetum cinerariifolium]
MAWFKWSSVLASKEKGGLGVACLFALNRALLFKWIWHFHNDKNSLWARFIGALLVMGETPGFGKTYGGEIQTLSLASHDCCESEFETEMDAGRDLLRCLVAYMELSE